jgi:hypothetical protein
LKQIKKEYTMSDSIRTYRAIRNALNRLYPKEPQGNIARRLNVLAALISGIVESRKVNLPQIADKIADENKPESHIKQFYRWIAKELEINKSSVLIFATLQLIDIYDT